MKFAKDREALSDEAVHCRGLGHNWVPYKADLVSEKSYKGYNVTLVCSTCKMMKHFMLSMRGEYSPATYSYPDFYLLAKGNEWITREDRGQFKLRALTDILPDENKVSPIKGRKRA